MRTVFIKNNTNEEKIWIKSFTANEEFQIPTDSPSLLVKYATFDLLLTAIANGDASIGDGSQYFTSISDQIDWLKGDVPPSINSAITSQPPYAEPLYRTKLDANSDIVELAIDTSGDLYKEAIVDYHVTDERYVYGGELVVKNAQFGDWVCASVYDKDGIIPVPYRGVLCEAWPVVAQYIVKRWVKITDASHGSLFLDTKPLSAKISSGLYLRVGYHAKNIGETRQIVMNYDFSKKL